MPSLIGPLEGPTNEGELPLRLCSCFGERGPVLGRAAREKESWMEWFRGSADRYRVPGSNLGGHKKIGEEKRTGGGGTDRGGKGGLAAGGRRGGSQLQLCARSRWERECPWGGRGGKVLCSFPLERGSREGLLGVFRQVSLRAPHGMVAQGDRG